MEFKIDLPAGVDHVKMFECIKQHGAYYILNMASELDAFIGGMSYCHPGFRKLTDIIVENPEILGLEPKFVLNSGDVVYRNISAVRNSYRQINYKTVVTVHDDIFTADVRYDFDEYDNDDDRYVSRYAEVRLVIPIAVIDNTITAKALKEWAKENVDKARIRSEKMIDDQLKKIKQINPRLFSKVVAKCLKKK